MVTVNPVRIALVAETFTPAVNGVANSVLHVADQLARRGHTPVVVAPSGADYHTRSGHLVHVETVPAMTLPGYRQLKVARPGFDGLGAMLERLAPDVVHLASPAVLGSAAVRAAQQLELPVVAVYQTDLAAFAARYRLTIGQPFIWKYLRRLHNAADLTLVPSTASADQLARHGIGPLVRWARGVDADLFHPGRRDQAWRREVGQGRLIVGFVGRLAPEKRVHLLAQASRLPGVQLVVVGDGPRRRALEDAMPDAVFTGQLLGEELGRVMASLDLLVHPGADETFCQVIQEALCAGVPVSAAAAGGPLDLVQDGRNGLLWRSDAPGELTRQIEALRDDPMSLARLALRTRASVVRRTWAGLTEELLSHYRAVIDARARGRRVA